ncbi:MAG: ankyrin repeat domain-containing protein [Candidatus Dependentiae bacterium]|nr:ankyrin repeat domain-containing protein [Candidatus Dependentiae bacterium]
MVSKSNFSKSNMVRCACWIAVAFIIAAGGLSHRELVALGDPPSDLSELRQCVQGALSIDDDKKMFRVIKHYVSASRFEGALNVIIGSNPLLHIFVLCGSVGMIDWFVSMKGDINVRNYWRETALHVAAEYSSYEVVKRLLEYGANMKLRSTEDESAFDVAVRAGRLDIIDLFLKKGMAINAIDKCGLTALHKTGDLETIEYLVQRGARLRKNVWGKTPLDTACTGPVLDYFKLVYDIHQVFYEGFSANLFFEKYLGKGAVAPLQSVCDIYKLLHLGKKSFVQQFVSYASSAKLIPLVEPPWWYLELAKRTNFRVADGGIDWFAECVGDQKQTSQPWLLAEAIDQAINEVSTHGRRRQLARRREQIELVAYFVGITEQ